jgi:cell fate (sporulation/competence/biofilm development) regulator YlbF (YheA/YmcA/DUF963 family)
VEEILAAASALGQRIARHDAFQRLRPAEDAVRSDPALKKLLEDFDRQRRKIEDLESARLPVEPEDKREMIRLSDAVHNSPKLQELVRAQADYMELMNRVNKAIQQALLPAGQTGSSSPQ